MSHVGSPGDGRLLVLARRRGESIVIDGTIIVTVLEIRGNRVSLGVDAPKPIPVHRKEVEQGLQQAGRTQIRNRAEHERLRIHRAA